MASAPTSRNCYDLLDGTIEPWRVFDRTVGLDGTPEGYRATNDRPGVEVLIRS